MIGSVRAESGQPVQPWTRDKVRDRIVELLSEVVGIPKDGITDSATLDNELQITSVALVEVQVAIEEMLDIQLDPIHLVELNQFGAIVDYAFQTAEAREGDCEPGRVA